MDNYGIISLVPVLVVIITAFITRRTIEPMLLGGIVGFIILAGKGFLPAAMDAMYKVCMDQTTVWCTMMFLLFGAIIGLYEKTGAAIGFSNAAVKYAKSEKSSLFVTWILGIIVFADDYLNALAVGVAMRNITDRYKIPRTFLAYVVASTGANVCCLIPVASWAAYMMGIMKGTGLYDGPILNSYLHTIPFLLYAWISLLIIPLIIMRIVPKLGHVKKEWQVAIDTGVTLPAGIADVEEKKEEIEEKSKAMKAALITTFIVPLLVMAAVAIINGDVLNGIIAGLVVEIIIILCTRLLKGTEICEACVSGAADMLGCALIVISAFFLQAANTQLGMTQFVIQSTEPLLSPVVFPLITFIIISLVAFGSGSFWGTAAIAFPIILPLAATLGVSMPLAAGALISGTVVGSHCCFFSDCATVVCVATGIRNSDYARSTLPLFIIPWCATAVAFLICGFIF